MMRPEVDISYMLTEVVAPALHSIARPGEIESVLLAWQPERGPSVDAMPGLPLELRLTVTMSGEEFRLSMWNVGEPLLPAADARERLASHLQDFVAESQFGWGQFRR
jgi:hypothetical protein